MNPCRTEVRRSQSTETRDPLFLLLKSVSRRREKMKRLRRDTALGKAWKRLGTPTF